MAKVGKQVEVLGLKIDQERFPGVYQWADKNPETLEQAIKGMIAKEGEHFSVTNAIVILESDIVR